MAKRIKLSLTPAQVREVLETASQLVDGYGSNGLTEAAGRWAAVHDECSKALAFNERRKGGRKEVDV